MIDNSSIKNNPAKSRNEPAGMNNMGNFMKMMKTAPSRLILAAAASLAMVQAATAQSMDYGSLQDLFGEPVTTSATGKPQRASEAPAPMTIIGAEEIARSGAKDLPDILNRVAGVDVLAWGTGTSEVGVRGYNQAFNPRLLVLVNGRQVYLDFYGFVSWSSIPVQIGEIRQIEVVKGPQAALFGFNAVSGVINIITYNPLYDDKSSAQVTAGTQNYREASLVKSLKLGDKVGVRISAGARDVDEYNTATRDYLERAFQNDRNLRRTASIDTLAQLTPDIQAGLEATWSRTDGFGFGAQQEPNRGTYGTYSIKGQVKANTGWGLLEATAYTNHLDFDLDFPRLGRINNLSTQADTTVVQLQDLVQISSSLTSRIGLEFRDNSMESYPDHSAKSGYKNYAISNMYDWKISDTLNLTVAGRYDRTALFYDADSRPVPFTDADYDRKINSWSYNVGLVWRPSPTDSVQITSGRGIQSPTMLELSNSNTQPVAPGNFVVAGNPYVDPVIISNYEVGYEKALEAIGGSARLAVFHQQTKGFKAFSFSKINIINGYPTLLFAENLGDSKMWGLEAELRGQMDKLRWGLSWTWLDVKDDFTFTPGTVPVNFETSTPRNTVKANLGWDNGKVSTDLFLIWKSETQAYFQSLQAPTLMKVDPGLTAQAAVTYHVTDTLSLGLTGANLLKKETELSVAPKAERRLLGTVKVTL
jgi:iron complex outermembrane receptor protein